MKYKILEKVSMACVVLAILGVFAAIFYSSEETTKMTELLGQLTCVVSLIGMGITFALWNREDSENELYGDNTTTAAEDIRQSQPETAAPVVEDAPITENTPEAVAAYTSESSENTKTDTESEEQ